MTKIKNNSRELYSQCSDLYRKMTDNLEDVLKQLQVIQNQKYL